MVVKIIIGAIIILVILELIGGKGKQPNEPKTKQEIARIAFEACLGFSRQITDEEKNKYDLDFFKEDCSNREIIEIICDEYMEYPELHRNCNDKDTGIVAYAISHRLFQLLEGQLYGIGYRRKDDMKEILYIEAEKAVKRWKQK